MVMVSEGFNPMDSDRPPREDGYLKETQEICDHLHNRGDQRIGQLILNAVRSEYVDSSVEEAADALWSLEAPELLELLENLNRLSTKGE